MDVTQSTLILSFVQSATEFLPVSSSGHLVLMEKFGFSNQSLLMDISLHVGTLLAVCAFFCKDIYRLMIGFWHKGIEQKIGFALIISTIPALIVGYFLNDIIETVLRSPFIIAGTSVFYGILLWVADRFFPATKTVEQITYKHALYIGLAQALALIPGTSRSGVTMTCARFLGYQRTQSAKYSMLMSVPVIALGAVYMFYKGFTQGALSTDMLNQIGIGMVASACFGLLAVWFLMKWLQRASFGLFAVYRIMLGLFLFYYFW